MSKNKNYRPRPVPTGPHGCHKCDAEPYTHHKPGCTGRE